MILPADGTVYAFFGNGSPFSVQCFDCSFVSTRALSVTDHPVPLCGFPPPFLDSSSHLVDRCDAGLGSSYGLI
ncbi:hypothetical protein TNCV_2976111 [Trichonephila clavipes]|nr:hypothetical protein TNCV_2976111 [Trichonephila clavipes]